MPFVLDETRVAKIKADFPALNVNQIAHKHGVAWKTVRNIVAPEPSNGKVHVARRAKHAVNGKHSDAELLTATWWEKLTLERRVKIMLEAL